MCLFFPQRKLCWSAIHLPRISTRALASTHAMCMTARVEAWFWSQTAWSSMLCCFKEAPKAAKVIAFDSQKIILSVILFIFI